jgi:DnaJ-class molecular chaperone
MCELTGASKMFDYLDELFPGHENTKQEDTDAAMAAARQVEAERIAAFHARAAAAAAERQANACPKCAGSGYLSQFAHIKAGECFTCGGSGVFSRYANRV